MKTRLSVSIPLALALCSCGSPSQHSGRTQEAQQTQRTQLPAASPTITYAYVSTYSKDGNAWRIVTVKSPISDAELVTLARQLHKAFPDTRFHIFDDGSQVKAYVDWTQNYPNPAYPYPEKWLRQHDLGLINRMLARGGARWELLGGEGHPVNPSGTIAVLE